MRRENRDFFVLFSGRSARSLNKVQSSPECLDAAVQQCAAYLHICVCALPFLTNDIIEINLTLGVTKVKPPNICACFITRERYMQL